MKTYTTPEEIESELRRLSLERKIALEEMRLLRYEVKDDLRPYNWVGPIIGALQKYGLLYVVRKLWK